MMELKTVEEYSNEMTRGEFDKLTEEQELCPSDLGLEDAGGDEVCSNDCIGCWDNTLAGITFKVAVPTLPKETLPVLKQLQALEIQSKSIEEQQKKLKEDLLQAMETYGVKKWDNDIMTITYTAPTTRSAVDSKKLKEELPDIFSKYIKTSNVKSSIRIKLKEVK
jgi:hypothetical protein